MKLLLLALSTLVVDLSFAEVCKTKDGEVCSFSHRLSVFFKANPCFEYMNKGSICFYDDKSNFVKHCDCSIAACNCAQDASEDGSSSDGSSSDNSSPDNSSTDDSSSECGSEKTTYCKLGDENTMCKYCGVDKGNCGSQVITREITDDSEKADIVDKHNDLRRKVAKGDEKLGSSKVADGERAQPPASNMNELVWDDEVAKMAQTWTDQCSRSAHDSNRKMAGGLYCGQNVYSSWNSAKSSSKALAKAVQSWYDEVKDFDNSAVGSFFNKDGGHTGVVGHYTQVVWADVSKIGCGYMYRVDPTNNFYKETVVCNYCKGGNMLRRAMYKTGAPATDCPRDHPNAHDGLCKK